MVVCIRMPLSHMYVIIKFGKRKKNDGKNSNSGQKFFKKQYIAQITAALIKFIVITSIYSDTLIVKKIR